MSRRSRDIDGQVFGKLTVVRFDHVENKRQYYLCRCECGKEKIVVKSNLTTGRTTSCGCGKGKKRTESFNKKVRKSAVKHTTTAIAVIDDTEDVVYEVGTPM